MAPTVPFRLELFVTEVTPVVAGVAAAVAVVFAILVMAGADW